MLAKCLKYLHSKLTINETYTYQGTREEIEDVLEQLLLTSKHGFSTNYDVYGKTRLYYMIANFSFGTMSGSFLSRIKIYFEYSTLNEFQQKVKVHTRVRPENWFLLATTIICTALVVEERGNLLPLIVGPSLLVLLVTFFNFFYKMQERSLIKDVRKAIGLKTIENS